MELIFAYLAGILTLINPCVLPVLPIVLASTLHADHRGPIALAAGMSVSFVAFGMFVSTIGYSIGFTEDLLSQIAAAIMLAFGAVLLIPQLSARFEMAFAGVSSSADAAMARGAGGQGVWGQFLGGALLGAVWSPCIGPTLGAAIALASQGESLVWAFLIMVAFAAGVSTFIIGIGWGGQEVMRTRAQSLRGLAEKSKTILGVAFVGVGLMILLRVHHMIEAWALRNLPNWFKDLSVTF